MQQVNAISNMTQAVTAGSISQAQGNSVSITRIIVKNDRLICAVQLAPGVLHYTNAHIAQALVARVPSLPIHTCKNNKGTTFGSVIAHTSIPHVLEHLVIDAQVRNIEANKGYDKGLFVGTTKWVNEKAGEARLELSFTDDIEAMRCLNQALDLLNSVLKEVS